jgi:hypothetical protein
MPVALLSASPSSTDSHHHPSIMPSPGFHPKTSTPSSPTSPLPLFEILIYVEQFFATQSRAINYLTEFPGSSWSSHSTFGDIIQQVVPSSNIHYVTVLNVKDDISNQLNFKRRALSLMNRLLGSNINGVTFQFVIAYQLSDMTVISSLSDDVHTALSASVESGQLLSLLKASGSSFLSSINDVSSPYVSSTQATTSNSSKKQHLVNIAWIIIIAVAAFLIVSFGCYYLYRRQKAVINDTMIEMEILNSNRPAGPTVTTVGISPIVNSHDDKQASKSYTMPVPVTNATEIQSTSGGNVPLFDANGLMVPRVAATTASGSSSTNLTVASATYL